MLRVLRSTELRLAIARCVGCGHSRNVEVKGAANGIEDAESRSCREALVALLSE